MLRVKAQAGDQEPSVIGQCFLSLLGMDPQSSIPFVARFLTSAMKNCVSKPRRLWANVRTCSPLETLIARWRVERSIEMKRAIELSLGVSRIPEAKEFLSTLRA